MKCSLTITKDGKPARAEVFFEDRQVTVATYSRSTGSPRLKQYPASSYGSNAQCFIGHLILEFLESGYSITSENDDLGRDRVSVTLDVEPAYIAALLPQLVPARALPELMKGRKILHERLLVLYEKVSNQHQLVLTFVTTGLAPDIATRLALAYRCAKADVPPRTNTFQGLTIDLPAFLKPLRDFTRLDLSVLDQFDKLGLALRPVDFRVMQTPSSFAGYVGF